MSKQPPPAPTASATGPCPTIIQIVGRPDTGSLPRTIAPPDHPLSAVDWVSSMAWSADLGAGVAGSCFIFLCVPDFGNSCGSDAVLGINDI